MPFLFQKKEVDDDSNADQKAKMKLRVIHMVLELCKYGFLDFFSWVHLVRKSSG